METNVPGIHLVRSASHAYLIDGDEGVTLVDTGPAKRPRKVLDTLSAIGRSVGDVRAIALTHAHSDHTGGAAALKSESNVRVIASGVDAPAIEGDEPVVPPPVFDRFPFLRPLFRFVPKANPVGVDVRVGEGAEGLPEDLTVIDTPGHTPGHVSYLLDRDGGVLFVGDAAVANRGGEVRRGAMNAAGPVFDASLRHLAEYDFEVALFAHSRPILRGAAAEFRKFANRLP